MRLGFVFKLLDDFAVELGFVLVGLEQLFEAFAGAFFEHVQAQRALQKAD